MSDSRFVNKREDSSILSTLPSTDGLHGSFGMHDSWLATIPSFAVRPTSTSTSRNRFSLFGTGSRASNLRSKLFGNSSNRRTSTASSVDMADERLEATIQSAEDSLATNPLFVEDERRKRCIDGVLVMIIVLGLIAMVNLIYPFGSMMQKPRVSVEFSSVSPTVTPKRLDPAYPIVHLEPPSEGDVIRIEAIKERVLLMSLSTRTDLQDLRSVPFYALRWISDTDEAFMDLDDEQLLQRYSLAVFFYSVRPDIAASHSNGEWWVLHDGTNQVWREWMSHRNICTWNGVVCESNSVTGLNLANAGISGTLPSELRGLTDLKTLDLSSNQLSSTIPPFVVAGIGMTKLENLRLNKNRFNGGIPASLNELNALVTLYLGDNLLVNSIPSKLDNLCLLEELHLANNKLVGTVPIEIEVLTSLKTINLQNNYFIQKLPHFYQLSDLSVVMLGRNGFTGTLPTSWADLTHLERLVLNHNSVHGHIPASYGRLEKLEYFWANENQLSGRLPHEFGKLTNLLQLSLDSNVLTGEVPMELGQLRSVGSIQLFDNHLVGTIPEEICTLSTEGSLHFLAVDCLSSVECTCCDECH